MARKYYGKTAILIPHISDNDTPDWMRIQLDVPCGIDRRKLLRATRKFLKATFGVKVSNDFVHRCCMIVNQHDAPSGRQWQPYEKRQLMDELVVAIQEEEDRYAAEAGGYSISEAETLEEAEMDMPVVQSQSAELQS